MPAIDSDLTTALRLLGEPTRLRMLALLDREELSVGELTESLGMAQSRVSNHLRQLREGGLLIERHSGTSTFLRLAPGADESVTRRLWQSLREELEALPEHAADLIRLEAILARRQGAGDFFDRVAGDWDKISGDFATGQARYRAASHLLTADLTIADLGCGTGYLAASLVGKVGRVICVDRSEGMLDEARKRLARTGRTADIEYRAGELDALPIGDDEVDGVVVGMVLHHLDGLERPLAEMRRVVRPGGSVIALDLAPHREEWMRRELGDRHLGLEASDVLVAFRRAGLEDVILDPTDDSYRPRNPEGETPDLPIYVVRGRVPRAS